MFGSCRLVRRTQLIGRVVRQEYRQIALNLVYGVALSLDIGKEIVQLTRTLLLCIRSYKAVVEGCTRPLGKRLNHKSLAYKSINKRRVYTMTFAMLDARNSVAQQHQSTTKITTANLHNILIYFLSNPAK